MEPSEDLLANIRTSVIEVLQLLADPEAQREYERNVAIADVPAELFCLWFDDVYHPESPAHQAAFSPGELDLLAEFTKLFLDAEAELPDPLPRLRELQAHPAWSRVVSGAASTLRGLAREG